MILTLTDVRAEHPGWAIHYDRQSRAYRCWRRGDHRGTIVQGDTPACVHTGILIAEGTIGAFEASARDVTDIELPQRDG